MRERRGLVKYCDDKILLMLLHHFPTRTLYLTSLQVMVAKVSSLLKTVKNVEEEAGRGVRSLENTIDSIEADIAEFDSPNPPKEPATPEDLIRSTKVGYNGLS